MTVATLQSEITVSGNSSQTVFEFPFIAVSVSDIAVVYNDSSGQQTTLSPSQYGVTINPPATGQIWGVGGSVTYPLGGSPIASGTSLTIQRILPLQQNTSLSNQGNFYAQVVEKALDIIVMQNQQIAARTGSIRGTWVTNTNYEYGDIVKDGVNGSSTGNYYTCAFANLSGTWTTDLAGGDWVLSLPATIPVASLPLSIGNGGTGQTSAAAALTALGGITLSGTNSFTGANSFTGGSITVHTQTAGDNSTRAASTAFVNGTALTLAAGTTAVTQAASDNSTKVATTAQVQAAVALAGAGTPQNWTPILGFGGGSIGITYGTQSGKYIQIGKLVFVEWLITLTSKGSSTGTATITGLPATASVVGSGCAFATGFQNMAGIATPFAFLVNGGTTGLTLAISDVSTGQTTLSDANFTNTTIFNGSATYIAQ